MCRRLLAASFALALAGVVNAQTTLPPPGQPLKKGTPNTFEIIGNSLVSAQQLFLGTEDKVYFVDKVEANPTPINNHPAWGSEWALASNTQRPQEVVTNSVLCRNGTWINVGGNQAVQWGGEPAATQDGTAAPYFNVDGTHINSGMSLLNTCDDGNCDWVLSPVPSEQRWYPTLETLQDGSIIILGGCKNGGYVNDRFQDNPTYQFFPPRGDGVSIPSPILQTTLPGKFSNWATVLLNLDTNKETALDNIPDAVRVYPASAGTIMLPLTPANNYTATVLFCGGSNIETDRWLAPDFHPPTYPASASCVKLTPDQSQSYEKEDSLPQSRVMVSMIFLPDGKIVALGGGQLGTAGYGNTTWAIGHSYGDRPVYKPALYDPAAPAGSKWSTDGLQDSTVARMYHSSSVLLPDGSVMVSGSNPNPDYTVGPDVVYPTEYRLLSQYSYGGPAFDITLDSEDLGGDVENVKTAVVSIIRPGFSTHNMNMGQRYVQLDSTYTAYADNNTAVLHVSQLPPNPAIIAPGPALIFVTVKGVPSVGKMIMVGSGQIGAQPVLAKADLKPSEIVPKTETVKNRSSTGNAAVGLYQVSAFSLLSVVAAFVAAAVFGS
ncbi:glyoxal oxidase [Ephemerocybe angulata]|uniref:Glyoxal oxidase n=1 Tax=Ephemerocybe angulata TaxID=980116 RepID=A0A8H6IFA3_9AGAR|nr:glyoxal oxidase [Tulosesus angulatus]